MALLEFGDKRVPIPVGELVLGSDPASTIVITGEGMLPRHALIQGQADGQVVIRKATPAADVMINGVRLGAEPTPMLHGDKIELGGRELTFVDERRTGSTQFMQAVGVPAAAGGAPPRPAVAGGGARSGAPSASTGGRVVSLTDGREYVVAGKSLVFGREAGCDVVVGGKDVSRRHAEITATPQGYVLVDASTNGTWVNEERVQGQRRLARADIVRIGEENFRFYADQTPAAVAPPPAPAAPPAPSAPRPPQPGALATLLGKAGPLKGQRFQIKTPVANVGRADYNDVVLPDGSVSTAHAKLQRREGVWVVVDLDSTNGSFVDDERVKGEAPVGPGATLRFGDVVLTFQPADDALGVERGGGTVVVRAPADDASKAAPPAPAPAPAPASPAAPSPRPPVPPVAARPAPKPAPPSRAPKATAAPKRGPAPPPEKKGKGCGASVVVLLAGATGVVALTYWLLA
ncbi:MAG TPA: FHA domain-containing protein [Gemmatimonadales bacterium]|nr:FHA domain-containing protein [Gemmatimonadales bacterium]